jgi:hypothetical protein
MGRLAREAADEAHEAEKVGWRRRDADRRSDRAVCVATIQGLI